MSEVSDAESVEWLQISRYANVTLQGSFRMAVTGLRQNHLNHTSLTTKSIEPQIIQVVPTALIGVVVEPILTISTIVTTSYNELQANSCNSSSCN